MSTEPLSLQSRPHYKTYPIPYTTLVVNGVPDFKITDMAAWEHCLKDKLCALCGVANDYWVWWIGGPLTLKNKLFFDLAMHEKCARYAAEVCPYLAQTRQYSNFIKDYSEAQVEVKHLMSKDSKQSFLMKARRDSMKRITNDLVSSGPIIYYEEIPVNAGV